MIWIMAAIMALVSALAILAPFRRGHAAPEVAPAAYDLRIYRDQLREVERDLQRGVISAEDAERLRTEIGRKVLDADRAMSRAAPAGIGTRSRTLIAAALLVTAIAATFAMYDRLGAPTLPDRPLATRFAEAQARYQTRPSQAEAEQAAPRPAPVTPAPEYAALIERLRQVMADNPDDTEGLALLARHEAQLGNSLAAKEAQARRVALLGDRADAQEHALLAALMVEAAGGPISPEAEGEIDRALQLDPRNGQARYMAGLLQAQSGRPDLTFPIWRDLLENSAPDSPWIPPIRAVIPELAWLAGEASYTPPAALPGSDADAVAAAGDMTDAERTEMIAGMVERLESRLATEGGTPDEWARLIASLVFIGQPDRATLILEEARANFADVPDALAMVNAAAKQAGLE